MFAIPNKDNVGSFPFVNTASTSSGRHCECADLRNSLRNVRM